MLLKNYSQAELFLWRIIIPHHVQPSQPPKNVSPWETPWRTQPRTANAAQSSFAEASAAAKALADKTEGEHANVASVANVANFQFSIPDFTIPFSLPITSLNLLLFALAAGSFGVLENRRIYKKFSLTPRLPISQ